MKINMGGVGNGKKDRTITQLLLSSYTIAFILGGLTFFISERNIDFQFSRSPIII